MLRSWTLGTALTLLAAGPAFAGAPEGEARRAGERPKVSLRLGAAEATGIPGRDHASKTGGGNFIVRQPSPDTLVITMTGLAKAGGGTLAATAADFTFDLTQAFTVVGETPDVRGATLQVQGYVMGVLRSPCKGTAGVARACCALTCAGAPAEVAGFCLPPRAVGPRENQSVYQRSERLCVPAAPVCYTLHQTFAISAAEPKCGLPGHGASADFSTSEDETARVGPRHDPFEGVSRRDFGFHVVVRAVPVLAGDEAPSGRK